MKLRLSSSRCKSCPAKGEPARAGSKPGADPRDGVCEAQACERAGRGGRLGGAGTSPTGYTGGCAYKPANRVTIPVVLVHKTGSAQHVRWVGLCPHVGFAFSTAIWKGPL